MWRGLGSVEHAATVWRLRPCEAPARFRDVPVAASKAEPAGLRGPGVRYDGGTAGSAPQVDHAALGCG